jgi:large subunit ribosomal protein L22
MTMRAFLKNNRQAPRKVRLVAQATVGKTVAVALTELTFMPQKAAGTLKKVIASAAANARQSDSAATDENLIVKNITVDKGVTYKRYRPRAFGRATPINRESSHIRVTLEKKASAKPAEKQETKKDAKPAAKKTTAKKTATKKETAKTS